MRTTEQAVPLDDGDLAVTAWGDAAATPVVAVHGITANGRSFGRVAAELAAGVSPIPLLAPDLRGRGRSRDLPGPYGLGRHVDDLIALLDHRGVDRTVLAGHSMGAFVACLAAVRHPDRIAGAVLVDGGYGLRVPAGTDIRAVLGPAMARLDMVFAGADAYREFWRAHPAFAGRWTPEIDAYVLRDLIGEPPEMRSACVPEAVRADGAQVLEDPETLDAVHRLPCPARLLWAARGLMDESPGLYTPHLLSSLADSGIGLVELADDNHYSVLFSAAAAVVAAQIRAVVQEVM